MVVIVDVNDKLVSAPMIWLENKGTIVQDFTAGGDNFGILSCTTNMGLWGVIALEVISEFVFFE